jgi:hypothetical protein
MKFLALILLAAALLIDVGAVLYLSNANADQPAVEQKFILVGTIFHYRRGPEDKQPTQLPLIYNGSTDGPIVFDTRAACERVLNTDPFAQSVFDKLTKLAAEHGDAFVDAHCMGIPPPPGEKV